MSKYLSHIEDFDEPLRAKCFEYFYWFSRFEFALKENNFARAAWHGGAEVDWTKFVEEFADSYSYCAAASDLIKKPPNRQVFQYGSCQWSPMDLSKQSTNLGKVVLIVRTIRNNLFHGGKSSQEDWDNPERNLFLLSNAKTVLDTLADMVNLNADYWRYY